VSNPQPDRVFAVIDEMDANEFGELLADDARLIFGNAEPMIGRGDITAGVSEFYTTIAGLRHVLVNTWTSQAYTVAQLDVTYRRLDGKEVTIPAATIYHTNAAAKIDDYRIFADLTPVYS
jgi:SnoaL-like protein